jgi:predicted regulator of Ras-like GTPase activity (Roadblock/LC7/MglB family)
MVNQEKMEAIVAETMAGNADLQAIIICDAKGKVLFGHTITGGIKHSDVAELAVKIAANSSQLAAGLDKGGLKEVSIASDQGYIIILGDVKLVMAAVAGDGARESMGLLRMALRRSLLSILGAK